MLLEQFTCRAQRIRRRRRLVIPSSSLSFEAIMNEKCTRCLPRNRMSELSRHLPSEGPRSPASGALARRLPRDSVWEVYCFGLRQRLHSPVRDVPSSLWELPFSCSGCTASAYFSRKADGLTAISAIILDSSLCSDGPVPVTSFQEANSCIVSACSSREAWYSFLGT